PQAARLRRRTGPRHRARRRRDHPRRPGDALYRAVARRQGGAAALPRGPAAAWYVNDILANAPPPPGVPPAEFRRGRRLAYKTGTSYGFRDAWAVGYDAEATIAVWAGRPDGTPLPGQSGRVTAAPIVFKIADLLGRPARAAPAPPPPGALIVSRQE